jgi:tight adherence protein C
VTTTLVLAVFGAGAGAGVALIRRSMTARPLSLAAALGRLEQAPRSEHVGAISSASRYASQLLESAGWSSTKLGQELHLVARTAEAHAVAKIVGLAAGIGGSTVLVLGLGFAGLAPPAGLALLLAAGGGVVGFTLPDRTLRELAQRRRRTFRHSLSSYLDLVNVLLAGGAGIETALFAAADAGEGWTYEMLRGELRRARLTSRSPWDTLGELAQRVGVSELAELAASVNLAGSHGARIRSSLAAKADSLRGHQVSEIEAEAEAATERMTVPVAVLLLGFLIFIAYPAVTQITSVSGP